MIELKGVTFGYDPEAAVLAGLDFSLARGERVGIVGANGSGKTTLFHLIVGLLKPQRGEVRIFDQPRQREKDFVAVRERIGLLFQDPDDQLFCPTVEEDVAFGPLNQGKSRDQVERVMRQTLAALGLEGFEKRITHKLSFGEKRLVSLATVLAMEPEVLLLDEPTLGLDEKHRERFTELLTELPQSLMVVSHDEDLLSRTTTSRYHLSHGKLEPVRRKV